MKNIINNYSDLDAASEAEFKRILEGDYCIGCGACAAVSDGIDIKLSDVGLYKAFIKAAGADFIAAAAVCPFSSTGPDENELSAQLFSNLPHHHTALGRYVSTWAGYVAEGEYRDRGSSGGMGSWLLAEAFRTGLIDKAIHVKAVDPDDNAGVLFAYRVSNSAEEASESSKSRYYPIELSQVLETIREESGSYALVGIPCFLKAVRRVCLIDPVIRLRLKFTVGLICGHLKTTGFGESLAWQLGVPPGEIQAIDFRRKFSSGAATGYGFMVKPKGVKQEIISPMARLTGRDWGMGFFKPNACEYCDDVTAELADVSIGDAWLPEFLKDSRGTNVVIVRNAFVDKLIEVASAEKRLAVQPITADMVANSQEAGLRHRRNGLAFRIWIKERKREWYPKKRIFSAPPLTFKQKIIMVMRLQLRKKSISCFSEAKKSNNINVFKNGVWLPVFLYKIMYLKIGEIIPGLKKIIIRKSARVFK